MRQYMYVIPISNNNNL